MTGRPFGNALNQIRTNEFTLADPWEMREFNLTETGLQPVTVKLTPDIGFENSSALARLHPSQPGGHPGRAARGAGALREACRSWARRRRCRRGSSGARRASTPRRGTSSRSTRAAGATRGRRARTSRTSLRGRRGTGLGAVGVPARRHGAGSVDAGAARTFDDLGRRATDLAALVCGTSSTQGLTGVETFGGFPAAVQPASGLACTDLRGFG